MLLGLCNVYCGISSTVQGSDHASPITVFLCPRPPRPPDHLGAAESDAALHCPHAAGVAVCVAPAPSAAETFCASFDATCAGNGGRFGSTAECAAVYNSLPAGDAGATSGASQACLECKGNHERMIGMPDRQTATPTVCFYGARG